MVSFQPKRFSGVQLEPHFGTAEAGGKGQEATHFICGFKEAKSYNCSALLESVLSDVLTSWLVSGESLEGLLW